MTGERLLPLNPEWISASIIWGLVALCRDQNEELWLCRMAGEAEGWVKIQAATRLVVETFRYSQKLAGKKPPPWPAGLLED